MDAQAEAEFTEFMLGSWARLYRLGYALTGDPGLAEDVVQTALAARGLMCARSSSTPAGIGYAAAVSPRY